MQDSKYQLQLGTKQVCKDSESDIPPRSGFRCECALCGYCTNDDTNFWGHITKTHNMKYADYKNEFGLCQIAIGSGKFQCQMCQKLVKYMPGSIDKHLKTCHGINWSKYLDWFRRQNLSSEQPDKGIKSEPRDEDDCNNVKPEEEVLPMEMCEVALSSKPMNIRNKSTKYCSQCGVIFSSRVKFLSHCQEVHKVRFKNKLGEQVKFKQPESAATNTSTGELQELDSASNSNAVSPEQSESAVAMPSKFKIEGAVRCLYCHKMFSSKGNRARHVKLACTGVIG